MKVNFERWCAIVLVGCLALGVAILPADGGMPFVTWFSTPERTRVELWQTRMYARQNHENSVLNAYAATRDVLLARDAFGSTPGKVGDLDVRFASDVPAAMRADFMNALNVERSGRLEWKGNGKVGVIVRIDTVTRINGRTISRLQRRYTRTGSRVIAPSAATGDRCVVVVELPSGDAWRLTSRKEPTGPVRPLLDACGFYDAFGMPGAEIGRDLAEHRFGFARGYPWITAPDTIKHPYRYAFLSQWYVDARRILCLAGDDQVCVDQLRGIYTERWYYPPVALPAGVTDIRGLSRDLPAPSELNRLVLALGPQRFVRVWKSPKTLEQAYLDESGQTLGQFVRRLAEHEVGVYHPGPWMSALTNFLTLLCIAGSLVLAMRFARRPKVA